GGSSSMALIWAPYSLLLWPFILFAGSAGGSRLGWSGLRFSLFALLGCVSRDYCFWLAVVRDLACRRGCAGQGSSGLWRDGCSGAGDAWVRAGGHGGGFSYRVHGGLGGVSVGGIVRAGHPGFCSVSLHLGDGGSCSS